MKQNYVVCRVPTTQADITHWSLMPEIDHEKYRSDGRMIVAVLEDLTFDKAKKRFEDLTHPEESLTP